MKKAIFFSLMFVVFMSGILLYEALTKPAAFDTTATEAELMKLKEDAAPQETASVQPVVTEQITEITEQTAPDDLAVLATMADSSTTKNQAWAGTFQLVWNDFINELLKAPAQFDGTQPVMVDELNKQAFSAGDLSDSAYYKKFGPASLKLKTEIEQGIEAKFNEKSDILDKFDWTPMPDKYFFYAMLKKDFEFIEKFQNKGYGAFEGSQQQVEYFGAESDEAKQSVWVLFYNDENDFAVRLQSKQGDQVYLYRTDKQGSLAQLYQKLKEEILSYQGSGELKKQDQFKAPMLDFDVTREFTELCGKKILPGGWMIGQALETIKFKMDEVGVKLKSEAAMMVLRSVAMPDREKPRYFFFDNRYAVFIAEKGKKPYFALLVEDAAKLQKPAENTEPRNTEQKNTDVAHDLFLEGLNAFNRQDYQTALNLWKKSLQADPDFSDAQLGIKKIEQITSR